MHKDTFENKDESLEYLKEVFKLYPSLLVDHGFFGSEGALISMFDAALHHKADDIASLLLLSWVYWVKENNIGNQNQEGNEKVDLPGASISNIAASIQTSINNAPFSETHLLKTFEIIKQKTSFDVTLVEIEDNLYALA